MAGLLDFAQAASNSAAGNVAGPIDMLAWGLRKMGLPIPNDPVLGTEWMKQKGLIKEVPQSPASLAGETLGLLSPIVAAAKAPQIAGGLLQMGDNLTTAKTLGSGPGGGQKGAIVYHGSPHKFDKFDSSKIGTGEGAQAYGHGLYLAESPQVAQTYAPASQQFMQKVASSIDDASGPRQEVLEMFNKLRLGTGFGSPAGIKQRIERIIENESADPRYAAGLRKAYDQLEKEYLKNPGGSLYKVDLPDEHIARMLDWDKPLSQQQKQAAALIKKDRPHLFSAGEYPDTLTLGSDLAARGIKSGPQDVYGHNPAIRYGVPAKHMTGQDYWHLFMRQTNNDAAAAANAMKALGFPGLRYLDGGSRAAGQGTSNFVVFPGNEGLLTIIERNGQRLP